MDSVEGSLFDLRKLKDLGGYKAGDLIAVDPELYQKFMSHLSRTVRRDEVIKNVVFETGVSAYTPEPINLFLLGGSSIGKTYNVVEALQYFPEGDVWLLGGLSPTALIHQHGLLVDKNGEEILFIYKPDKGASSEEKEAWRQRLKDSHIIVDLKGKILVFLEAPNYRTFNMLRPILSHDTFKISYKFTDKTGQGRLQTQHVIIRGWPATIFCSTQEKYVQDLSTRGFTVTPETTPQKYQDANVLSGSRAAFPWKFTRDLDFMLLEGYIRTLKNKLEDVNVIVPYAVEFAKIFPCRFSRSMRDFKHVLSLIKVSALFHFAQRPIMTRKVRVEVESEDPLVPEYKEVEEHYVMAVRGDHDFAVALWDQIRETTETSAPGHIINFFHKVVEEVAKEKADFLIEDLTTEWNLKSEDKKSSDTIRRWTKFLCDIEYLSPRPDQDNKKRNVYKIIRENQKTRKYTHLSFPDMFTLDSLKAWLNKGKSITAHNQVLFKENLVSNNEISCEDLYSKYFLNKNGFRVVIGLSDSRASTGESDVGIAVNQECVYVRDFQPVNSEAVEKISGKTLDTPQEVSELGNSVTKNKSVGDMLRLLRSKLPNPLSEEYFLTCAVEHGWTRKDAQNLFESSKGKEILMTPEGSWQWV